MSAADDAAILDALAAVPNLRVFDGYVTDSDEAEKTISAPLPYVVYYTLTDENVGDTLGAVTVGARLHGFQINYVGATAEQARAVRDRVRGALDRAWVTMPAGDRLVRRDDDDSQAIRRDDAWTRPDGGPLFYGVDRYRVGA